MTENNPLGICAKGAVSVCSCDLRIWYIRSFRNRADRGDGGASLVQLVNSAVQTGDADYLAAGVTDGRPLCSKCPNWKKTR